MNEEIHYITNKEKTVKNEWENNDSNFLQALHRVYKTRTILFLDLFVNLFKEKYISSVRRTDLQINKYLNKLTLIWLGFLGVPSFRGCQGPLNFADVSIFFAKNSIFAKNCTFTQNNIVRAVLEIF